MAITFGPKYTIIDRDNKDLSFTCTRTDDSTDPDTVDSVSGDAQLNDDYKKADVMEHIGKLFDQKDANATADALLIADFEAETKTYLENRGV
jgi:hypothetical protein